MIWALKFNGSPQYAKLFKDAGTTTIYTNMHTSSGRTTFEYIFGIAFTGTSIRLLGYSVNYSSYFNISTSNVSFRMGSTSSTLVTIPCSPINDGELHHYKVQRDGVNFYVYIDGVLSGSTTSSVNGGGTSVDVIGRNSSAYSNPFDLAYFICKDAIDGTELYNFNADLSDRSTLYLSGSVADETAIGQNMPTDGSAWIDLGGGSVPADQDITAISAEQLTQTQTISISELNAVNAIIYQQTSNSQLADLTLSNQLSTVTAEQVTSCSLSAIANINTITAINTEQLSQGQALDNSASQVIYAVQAQQLSQALTVNITSSGSKDIDVVITEQLTQSQVVSTEELQQLQVIITQQITESINAGIEQQLALTAITTEQLTQAVTVTIDESSGIFVSVVQTEQLTQAISANIDVAEIISTVIAEQLTQHSAQQVSIDLTVSAVIAEQLTQAELINVVLQNISNQLNIDIDQISIEMLTPTYTIEMLTPTYTIEHIH